MLASFLSSLIAIVFSLIFLKLANTKVQRSALYATALTIVGLSLFSHHPVAGGLGAATAFVLLYPTVLRTK